MDLTEDEQESLALIEAYPVAWVPASLAHSEVVDSLVDKNMLQRWETPEGHKVVLTARGMAYLRLDLIERYKFGSVKVAKDRPSQSAATQIPRYAKLASLDESVPKRHKPRPPRFAKAELPLFEEQPKQPKKQQARDPITGEGFKILFGLRTGIPVMEDPRMEKGKEKKGKKPRKRKGKAKR